jgi:hypothetical protein
MYLFARTCAADNSLESNSVSLLSENDSAHRCVNSPCGVACFSRSSSSPICALDCAAVRAGGGGGSVGTSLLRLRYGRATTCGTTRLRLAGSRVADFVLPPRRLRAFRVRPAIAALKKPAEVVRVTQAAMTSTEAGAKGGRGKKRVSAALTLSTGSKSAARIKRDHPQRLAGLVLGDARHGLHLFAGALGRLSRRGDFTPTKIGRFLRRGVFTPTMNRARN